MRFQVTSSTAPVWWWCTENCSDCPHYGGPNEREPVLQLFVGMGGARLPWWRQLIEYLKALYR